MTQFAAKLYVDGNVEVIPFVEDQLKVLQTAVGGYVEAITLAPDLVMWVNEEGKMNGMPFNQAATSIFMKYRGGADYIVGPVVFTSGADENGETVGITEAQIQQLKVYAAMSKVD
jgi:hypothetical protein